MKRSAWIGWVLIVSMMLGAATVPAYAESPLCSYASEIGNSLSYSDKEESPLYGRNALFFGDSLCNASGERGSRIDAGYAGRIGVRYEMNWQNHGASGYALASGITGGTILSKVQAAASANKRLEEPVEYELVVLQGGVNDAWQNGPLGEMSESFDRFDFDSSNTFAGGLERTLYFAKELFPNATVCYIIMYQMPLGSKDGKPVSGIRDQSAYVALQKQILEKWEIPYLDLYNDTEFNEDIFKVTTTEYLAGDYAHMNSAGYEKLTGYLIPWLESLSLPERVPVESEAEDPPTKEDVPLDSEVENEETEEMKETVKKEQPKWLTVGLVGGSLLIVGGAFACGWFLKKRGKQ